MYRNATPVGGWTELTDRLDGQGALERWALREPTLAGLNCEQLSDLLRQGVDPALADALLGALVRLGAAAGGADPDAVLLLLHLLSDGAAALAGRLGDLADDVLGLIVGELTVQIRAFPVERRTRAYAANLLHDTRAAVLRELLPHRSRSRPHAAEVLVDPTDPQRARLLFEQKVSDDQDVDLLDLLVWAERTGVVDGRDVVALLATERARDERPDAQRRFVAAAAAAAGMSPRTTQRRHRQALTALRAARSSYLSAVA